MDGITTSINAILKNLIKNFNTLLDCPVRFSGEYDRQKVHNFIECIEYYKGLKCIGDEQALQELQHLLRGHAHSWWLRRKTNLNTWSEALTVLESHFSKRRPAHVIYAEILKQQYHDYESKDDFIDDKIELFNELSQPELKNLNMLEILYALLPCDIKNEIKFENITSMGDLKEQLKLVKCNGVEKQTNVQNTISEISIATQHVNNANKETNCLEENAQITVRNEEPNTDMERDPIIKVRRTEDLMPQDIKEEEPPQQEEFVANDIASQITNDIPNTNQDDFQIDNDIMNQINNIIDESEMNMNALNSNQVTPILVTKPTDHVESLNLLGFDIKTITSPEVSSKKSTEVQHESKSALNATKKIKIRCSYCRRSNHIAQACFKRARHMKEFPEKFLTTKNIENNKEPLAKSNNDTIQTFANNSTTTGSHPSAAANAHQNDTNNSGQGQSTQPTPSLQTTSSSNMNTSSNLPTETVVNTPSILLNQTSFTSIPYTPHSTTPPIVTNSSNAVIINNVTEKCINSTLTTKLIAPINGKTTNKILAAKLRSTNTPSPKCHQCGNVGFYKSICPNCSPIYNNNNHNPYCK